MGLLLYKSNEMFSSTELIRKSKMIFNKILNEEVEKAIILRDGKPSFLLMEFGKYENIMAEFEELKEYVESIKKNSNNKRKIKEKIKPIDTSAITVNVIKKENIVPKLIVAKDVEKEEDISEDDELKNALESIESMNFDDNMKKVAQDKIKTKILQARKIREEELSLQKEKEKELKKAEEEEEAELQKQIEVEKEKKERELKEFWD
jgi:hypothetical protein